MERYSASLRCFRTALATSTPPPTNASAPPATHAQRSWSPAAPVVRDRFSLDYLVSHGIPAKLIPDAAHVLGELRAPAADRAVVALIRRDNESTGHRLPDHLVSTDWPRERRISRRARQAAAEVSKLMTLTGVPLIDYDRVAQTRVQRGIRLLSQGETIITDRLHAMILGLHLGRRVIAIDNNVKKLSRYRDTWLSNLGQEDLSIVTSAEAALLLVDQ